MADCLSAWVSLFIHAQYIDFNSIAIQYVYFRGLQTTKKNQQKIKLLWIEPHNVHSLNASKEIENNTKNRKENEKKEIKIYSESI